MKSNTVWLHFTATGYFPTNIHLSRPIPKVSVRIETHCCIFKQMIIDWMNTEVISISGIRIEMPNEAKISIFTDNDLTHITDDHFEINLIACLLDQIYVVPSPQSPLRYDDAPPDTMTFAQSVNSTLQTVPLAIWDDFGIKGTKGECNFLEMFVFSPLKTNIDLTLFKSRLVFVKGGLMASAPMMPLHMPINPT